MTKEKRYGAIDGLRTIACIGIVMMYIKANDVYEISGFAYGKLISSFTNFVSFFMVFLPSECAVITMTRY